VLVLRKLFPSKLENSQSSCHDINEQIDSSSTNKTVENIKRFYNNNKIHIHHN